MTEPTIAAVLAAWEDTHCVCWKHPVLASTACETCADIATLDAYFAALREAADQLQAAEGTKP